MRQKTAFIRLFPRTLCAAFSASVLGVAACDNAPAETVEIAEEDRCQPISLADALPEHLSHIADDMRVLRQLPYAGHSVYSATVDPQHSIEACVAHDINNGTLAGSYNPIYRHLTVIKRTSSTTTAHEAFHAFQSINNPSHFRMDGTLTARDVAFGHLLMEAAAAAYELVVIKEAQLRGVRLPRSVHDGVSSTHAMRAAFNRGYNEAIRWEFDNEEDRQRAALQRGGQTALFHLMSGESAGWSKSYTTTIVSNWPHYRYRAATCSAEYAAERDRILLSLGDMGNGLNLVPLNYLGANAEENIQQAFDAVLKLDGDTMTCSSTTSAPRASRPGA